MNKTTQGSSPQKRDWSKIIFLTIAGFLLLFGSFCYGILAIRMNLQPWPLMLRGIITVKEVLAPSDKLLQSTRAPSETPIDFPLPDQVAPGLVAVAGDYKTRHTEVKVMDREGGVIHSWKPNWSEIWPGDEGDFSPRPADSIYLHGVMILPDGSLVANFEHYSTFRLDVCGNLMWKLDNLGHHSVNYAPDGTIWATAERRPQEGVLPYPMHAANLRDWTMQNISMDGEILRTIPVIDVLLNSDYEGLLYVSDRANPGDGVWGDTLHLNDIDTFPEGMESEIFETGDVMFSLRNISGIFVMDPDTLALKYVNVGQVMRQHDPDFVEGDWISVFDNRTFSMDAQAPATGSRIIEFNAVTGERRVVVDGADPETEFFSQIMSVHQPLPNGNTLIVVSDDGRLVEYTPDRKLAWRYENQTEEGLLRIYWAEVLPPELDENFFREAELTCNGN